MQVEFEGKLYEFPDDATDDEIRAVLAPASEPKPAPEPAPDSFLKNTSDVVSELAAGANRGFMDLADFFGPGSINAAARLSNQYLGTDFGQLPTFGETFREYAPGAEGGFMEPGTAREAVRAAGEVFGPGAAATVPVVGRNIAKVPGALAELTGMGYGAPGTTAARVAATQGVPMREPGALSDVPTMVDPTPQVPMAQRADEIGFPISPGERVGDRAFGQTLRNLESAIESTLIPFNPAHRQAAKRQQMMNEAAGRAIGAPRGAALTDDVVGDVAAELSDEFKRLGDLETLRDQGALTEELVNIQDASRTRIFQDPDVEKVINTVFDRLDNEGQLSVRDYQDITSELKAKVRQAWKGESPDPYFAETLGDIIDALDNMAMGSVEPQDMARLQDARRRWKALSQLEKSRALRESGDVSPQLLANYLRRTDKGGYGRGGNRTPLYETARLSKAFPSRPDSGTATRQYLNQLLMHPIGGAIGLALAPATSSLANLYWRGGPAAVAQVPQYLRRPGITSRVGGYLED